MAAIEVHYMEKNPGMFSSKTLKCPYYGLWLWKVHILVLGVPNNRLTCMQGQKTLSLSYNMHLFLPYLLNNSQTICSTIHFSKPLLCVMLICGDCSNWSHFNFIMPVMPDKAALCTALPGKQLFLASKAAPSGKEWICIFIQTNWKDQQVGGQYANASCWHQHETAWDSF